MFDKENLQEYRLENINGIHEYLLVISPDEIVSGSLTELKEEFHSLIPTAISKSSKPHLTLISFIFISKNELQLIKCFEIFSKSINPFEIKIDGFGVFTGTIYANVISKDPVICIVKGLKERYKSILKRDWTRFFFTPHLTIARKITEKQKEEAWKIWRHKKYKSSFRANEMILLRRKIGGGKCIVVGKFRFTGESPLPIQGKLF